MSFNAVLVYLYQEQQRAGLARCHLEIKPSTVFFSATLPAIANGAALNKRQSVTICYGDKGPNWNDCDSLVALLGWTGTSTGKIEPDPSGGPTFYHDHHALNCEIGIAWNDPNNRLSITISSLLPYINIIKDKCVVRSEAGGESNSVDDNWTVRVTNDPRYNPPAMHRRQVEGDTYSLEILSRAIERPGFRQKVGPSLPSGSSYTVTKGEANTTSAGASFEISGGFFELFEAGAGASFESSHTVENIESTQINVNCGSGKNGQIYWVPKRDHYEGTFMPSNTPGEVWTPLDDSAADYMIECQG